MCADSLAVYGGVVQTAVEEAEPTTTETNRQRLACPTHQWGRLNT